MLLRACAMPQSDSGAERLSERKDRSAIIRNVLVIVASVVMDHLLMNRVVELV